MRSGRGILAAFRTDALDRRSWIYLSALVLAAIWLALREPAISPDTPSYLRLSFNRGPGYSLLLRTIWLIFGEAYSHAAVAFHALVAVVACHRIGHALRGLGLWRSASFGAAFVAMLPQVRAAQLVLPG